jgi:hypothetical protein
MNVLINLTLITFSLTQLTVDPDRPDYIYDLHTTYDQTLIYNNPISKSKISIQAFISSSNRITEIVIGNENGLYVLECDKPFNIKTLDNSKIDFLKYFPDDSGDNLLYIRNKEIYLYGSEFKKIADFNIDPIDIQYAIFLNLLVFGKGNKLVIYGQYQFGECLPPYVIELGYSILQLSIINYGGERIAISDGDNIYFHIADEDGKFELERKFSINNKGFHVKYDKFYIFDKNTISQVKLKNGQIIKSVNIEDIKNIRNVNYNTIAVSTTSNILFLNDDLQIIYQLNFQSEEIEYFTIAGNLLVASVKKNDSYILKIFKFTVKEGVHNEQFLEEYLTDYNKNIEDNLGKKQSIFLY